jgi:hypothetical protein
MSKELLRVTMSATQVREACEEWAWQRCGLDAATTSGRVDGIADDQNSGARVEVIFTKRRVRASKSTHRSNSNE